jgi:hypothetical protein
MNIFHLNWVLIDTIIIFLLIFLLVSVKLYKENARWRNNISNLSLEVKNFPLEHNGMIIQEKHLKNMRIVRNLDSIMENKKPPIIFNKNKSNEELTGILIQGLASYGFTIVSLKFKTKDSFSLSKLLDIINQKILIQHSKYIFIGFDFSHPSYQSILNDSKNSGMILINPIYNKTALSNFKKVISSANLKDKLCVIHNYYSFFLFKNRNLKKILNLLSDGMYRQFKLITIQNARVLFKNYETVLLGFIIRYIEDRINQS